jgi:HEAT repeat protein
MFVVLGAWLALPAASAQTPDRTGPAMAPVPLGALVADSDPIVVLRVDAVRRDERVIVFGAEAALKGRAPAGPIRHQFDIDGGADALAWARPGRRAVAFFQGGRAAVCLDNSWYYCESPGGGSGAPIWSAWDDVEGFLYSYAGPADRLREHVGAILAGRKVVIPGRAPESDDALLRLPHPASFKRTGAPRGRLWRIKAGLRIRTAVLSEDSPFFVGWGGAGPGAEPDVTAAPADRDARGRAGAAPARVAPDSPDAVAALAQALVGDKEDEVRFEAARALYAFGGGAAAAVPSLREAACGKKARPAEAAVAADLLARLEPPAVEVLAEALSEGEPFMARTAADLLAELGPAARGAAPALREILARKEDPWVTLPAARALVRVAGPPAVPEVLPLLRGLVAGDRNWACEKAMAFLGDLGAEARSAAPDLAKVLAGRSLRKGLLAAGALGKVGGEDAVKALRAALQSEWGPVRVAAAGALWRLGRREEALAALVQALGHEDTEARDGAARLLGEIGPAAREAAAALRRARGDDSALTAAEAAVALRRVEGVGRAREGAVAALHAVLDRSGEWTRPEDEPLCSGLWWEDPWRSYARTAVEEQDARIADRAVAVLRLLAADADPAPALAAQLEVSDPCARLVAAVALARLDPAHPATASALVRLLEKHPELFGYLADTLAYLGPKARAAVPWLRRALRHENRVVYRAAAGALRRIDPPAAAAVWGPAAGGDRLPAVGEALWDDLGTSDPVAAFGAVWRLARADGPALGLLAGRLPPARAVPAGRLGRLIADLDGERFEVREKATAELEEVADQAEASLRRALTASASPEARRRLGRVLASLDPAGSPRVRRTLRAVWLLEQTATPEAQALLRRLAAGAPEALLTQEARASLGRLAGRAVARP